MNQYCYRVERGKAVLNRGDDYPLKMIGQFPSDALAKDACHAHHAKACRAAKNFGRNPPTIHFF
jgi:hypothetical protein